MPSITEAFKTMCNRGVIAECQCYSEQTARDVLLREAERWREQGKKARGFAHLGEWDPTATMEVVRVPVLFGAFDGDRLVYSGPDSIEVGNVVAGCLRGQGVPYEWDQKPGNPILVPDSGVVTGIPPDGHDLTCLGGDNDAEVGAPIPPCMAGGRCVDESDNFRFASLPDLPEDAFDQVGNNPVRLLNVGYMRRHGLGHEQWLRPVKRPRIGDYVKLSFSAQGALSPEAVETLTRACGDPSNGLRTEGMWVEVMSVQRSEMQPLYCGKLDNEPVFIDSGKLHLGSEVYSGKTHLNMPPAK